MLTDAEINAGAATLSTASRANLLALIRSYPPTQGGTLVPDLAATVDGADTITTRLMNAALTKINAIGSGTEQIERGPAGVNYSAQRDRWNLVRYVITALYPTLYLPEPGEPAAWGISRISETESDGTAYDWSRDAEVRL